MPACREPDNANPFRINAPLHSPRAHRANGALGVKQRHKRMSPWQPVFEHHTRDPVPVEPLCNAVSFGSNDQSAVSSTWANHHRGAVRWGCAMHRDRGIGILKLASTNGGMV